MCRWWSSCTQLRNETLVSHTIFIRAYGRETSCCLSCFNSVRRRRHRWRTEMACFRSFMRVRWWWPHALCYDSSLISSCLGTEFRLCVFFFEQRKWNDERNYNIYDYDAFHSLWREIRRRRCRCISFHLICSSSELIRLRPFSVLGQFISIWRQECAGARTPCPTSRLVN